MKNIDVILDFVVFGCGLMAAFHWFGLAGMCAVIYFDFRLLRFAKYIFARKK